MSNIESKRARSQYRQVRLTVTQQQNGILAYSVHVKPLGAAWDEHTCVLRAQVEGGHRDVRNYEDALRLVVEAVSGEMLPP